MHATTIASAGIIRIRSFGSKADSFPLSLWTGSPFIYEFSINRSIKDVKKNLDLFFPFY